MSGDRTRYAVYFLPRPGTPLARFGANWLGYDVASGEEVAQLAPAAIGPQRVDAITAEPRHYGFHATLKPPFFLADGTSPAELDTAVAGLAERFPAFVVPPLRLSRVSGFWALTLSEPSLMLDGLAALCVGELDGFRASPSPEEMARRRQAGLSPEQDALLVRWGYPYVMKEFRFHMTLTARLDAEEGAAVGAALAPLVEPFCQAPLPIDAIAVLRQEHEGGRFRLLRRYALTG
jgi:putative phosphonate metabolism protein